MVEVAIGSSTVVVGMCSSMVAGVVTYKHKEEAVVIYIHKLVVVVVVEICSSKELG